MSAADPRKTTPHPRLNGGENYYKPPISALVAAERAIKITINDMEVTLQGRDARYAETIRMGDHHGLTGLEGIFDKERIKAYRDVIKSIESHLLLSLAYSDVPMVNLGQKVANLFHSLNVHIPSKEEIEELEQKITRAAKDAFEREVAKDRAKSCGARGA
jgi:hypothetical protein